MSIRFRSILCFLASLTLVAGCGYQFAGMGKLPAGAQTVCVTMLKNNTNETGIERILTNAIIDEMSRSGITMIKDQTRADAVLTGAVTSVYTQTIARSSANTSTERRVYVKLDMKLTTSKGKVVWARSGLGDDEAYTAGGSDEDRLRVQAIEDLVKRLSRTVYQRLTDDF
jgi:outer membrane lipopolysaccharide assembly protein LptE/RlpB